MKKVWVFSMIFSGMAASAIPVLANGDTNDDGFATAGIESLTTTAGEVWDVAKEDDENKDLVVKLPADVSADGTIAGGLTVSCLAAPNEADGFQTGSKGDVVWKVMKGHETKGSQNGGTSFSYVIQRLGRYRISATSGNTIAQRLIVGPMTIPNDTGNDQLGPVAMSKSGNDGERFIVVPPKTTAFPQDKIILKALGSADDQFEALFEWTCDPAARGTANNDKANLYEVKRADFQDPQSLAPVVLKVQLKSSGTELDKVTILSGYVEEVKFSGNGSNYHEIRPDDGGPIYQAPHLKDTNGDGDGTDDGEENKPVAFTRNTKPTIAAKLKIGSASNLQNIKIRAHGSDGVEIPETTATVSGDYVSLPPTECSTNLPDTIKYYDKKENPFELEWQVQIDGGYWATVATTKHTVYVTLGNPVTTLRQETLFKIGCKNGQDNTSEAPAITAIWQEFTDREVKRIDGTALKYYGRYDTTSISTGDLLKDADGGCESWCKLFVDVLRIQGISGMTIQSARPSKSYEDFLIKKWDLRYTGSIDSNPGYDFLNIRANDEFGPSGYNWKYSEITDLNGLAGQGRENPNSIFKFHYMVFKGNVFYDPSYGVTRPSLVSLLGDVAGFMYLVAPGQLVDEPDVDLDLNNNGTKAELDVPVQKCSVARNQFGIVDIKSGDDLAY